MTDSGNQRPWPSFLLTCYPFRNLKSKYIRAYACPTLLYNKLQRRSIHPADHRRTARISWQAQVQVAGSDKSSHTRIFSVFLSHGKCPRHKTARWSDRLARLNFTHTSIPETAWSDRDTSHCVLSFSLFAFPSWYMTGINECPSVKPLKTSNSKNKMKM